MATVTHETERTTTTAEPEPSWLSWLKERVQKIEDKLDDTNREFRRLNGSVQDLNLWKARQEGAHEARTEVAAARRWRGDYRLAWIAVLAVLVGGICGGTLGWIGHALGAW